MNPIRLLLIYDVPEWACHSDCLALAWHVEQNAPGRFRINVAQGSRIRVEDLVDYDIVLSTVYYGLIHAAHQRSISYISSYSYWIRKSWTAEQNTETGVAGWPHLTQWKYLVAHNKDIFDRLTPEDHPDIRLLYHTFDPTLWTPGDFRPATAGHLTIGYAGHRQDLKGLHLIEEAARGLSGIHLRVLTYEGRRIPQSQMPDFYRSLDAYVCMSAPAQDAGPRPPIEAGLCGIPVVTTLTGQIGEMIAHGVNGLIVERNAASLRSALCQLRDNLALRQHLSTAIRSSFLDPWVMRVGQDWTRFLLSVAEEEL